MSYHVARSPLDSDPIRLSCSMSYHVAYTPGRFSVARRCRWFVHNHRIYLAAFFFFFFFFLDSPSSSELQNKVTTLQDSVERNGQRMEVLMDEITDFGQKNTALKAQIDGLQSDVADLNAAAPSRRDELQKLKQQEDSMDSEEKEVNLEVETLNETLSEVEEELKEIKKQIADVQVEEDKKHNRIERERERMEDKRRKRDYKAKVAAEAKENTDNKSLLNSNATKKAPAGQSKACSCCVVL